MARPRVGFSFEGNLFPGHLQFHNRHDFRRLLSIRPISNHIGELLVLMAETEITVFPLFPGRGRAHFIAAWLERRFADHFHDDPNGPEVAVAQAMAAIEVADRRPDDLDVCVDYTAPCYDVAHAFHWPSIKLAMQRGWALQGNEPGILTGLKTP